LAKENTTRFRRCPLVRFVVNTIGEPLRSKICQGKTLLLPFEITPGLSAVLNDDGGVAAPRRC